MEITRGIITDLLPAYESQECSADTKRLVEEYFMANPDFARQVRSFIPKTFQVSVPGRMLASDEMRSLKKSKKLLKLRAGIMGLAIFFSLAPFSVFNVEGKTHWLLLEDTVAACIYGAIGLALWITYFVIRHRTRIL